MHITIISRNCSIFPTNAQFLLLCTCRTPARLAAVLWESLGREAAFPAGHNRMGIPRPSSGAEDAEGGLLTGSMESVTQVSTLQGSLGTQD